MYLYQILYPLICSFKEPLLQDIVIDLSENGIRYKFDAITQRLKVPDGRCLVLSVWRVSIYRRETIDEIVLDY